MCRIGCLVPLVERQPPQRKRQSSTSRIAHRRRRRSGYRPGSGFGPVLCPRPGLPLPPVHLPSIPTSTAGASGPPRSRSIGKANQTSFCGSRMNNELTSSWSSASWSASTLSAYTPSPNPATARVPSSASSNAFSSARGAGPKRPDMRDCRARDGRGMCRYSLTTRKGSSVSGDDRFLAADHPLARALAEADERMLPPLDVVDWWEHPGEEGRMSPTGVVGVPRQLVVTTRRLLVLREGNIERSVALASIGGAQVLGPSDFPLEDSERAVLVRSRGEEPVAWGCWSTAKAAVDRLMGDIFSLANGVALT
jgi:hypothetical protein